MLSSDEYPQCLRHPESCRVHDPSLSPSFLTLYWLCAFPFVLTQSSQRPVFFLKMILKTDPIPRHFPTQNAALHPCVFCVDF